ncbi:hypothetical protein [Rhodoligotrophos defluvii]|uniref:hypothetical protein n=1 Tax=Rhodoligotrophos defluvii TaxID=2561934 RepID=UPI0010C988E5|nr:hypothetical protein [Rhodoligotrophos defluvii]
MKPIEQDVPVLPRSATLRAYPFEEMELGQHFSVPMDKYNSVKVLASRLGRRLGRVFVVRKMEKDGREVAGVWRVE